MAIVGATLDGTVWFVPNGEIRKVGNTSMEWSRALIDVVAPGYNVYSTKKPNLYGGGSGTSFSTPLANGVIGMIWSAFASYFDARSA